MGRYPAAWFVMRSAQGMLVMFSVVTVVFITARAVGDPVALLTPLEADEEYVQQLREKYGLDDPVYVQYGRYLLNAGQLDMGESFRTGRPAMTEVLDRLPATIQLGFGALVFAVVAGVPAGVIAAVWRGGPVDALVRLLALIGQAMPNFWLGTMLILLFTVQLHWLPSGGRGGWDHFILPVVTLGSSSLAAVMRLTRSAMLEVLSSDFIRTARAKGLQERVVVTRHALRNALAPVLSIMGVQAGRLLSGVVVVETVFAWPGMGRLMIQSIGNSDYPVVQASVLLTAGVVVLANFVVDVAYTMVDPRIRSGAG